MDAGEFILILELRRTIFEHTSCLLCCTGLVFFLKGRPLHEIELKFINYPLSIIRFSLSMPVLYCTYSVSPISLFFLNHKFQIFLLLIIMYNFAVPGVFCYFWETSAFFSFAGEVSLNFLFQLSQFVILLNLSHFFKL